MASPSIDLLLRSTDALIRSPRFWSACSWLLVALGCACLGYRILPHFGWHVEDAYISMRYATHLAEGHGLVWNVGGERVEGFTSPLHVWLLAAGMRLGIPLTSWASLLNLLSVVMCIAAYLKFLYDRVGSLTPIAAALLFVFLVEDRLAVHATAGLDTTMYMALIAWNIVVSLRLLAKPSATTAVGLAVINLLSLLGRPDAAPFIAAQGLVLGFLGVSRRHGERGRALLWYTFVSYASLFTAGLVYLGWKLSYFGTVLPNPFYIKSNSLGLDGLKPVIGYLSRFVPRFGWLVLVALPFMSYRTVRDCWIREWAAFALILVPSFAFLAYYATVLHEVSYMNRFEYPVYMPLLMALAWILSVGQPVRNGVRRHCI